MPKAFLKTLLLTSLCVLPLAPTAAAEDSSGGTVTLDAEGGGSLVLITNLRSDLEVHIQDNFKQTPEQLQAARRAAAILQIMSTNEKVSKEEAQKHMFLHMTTTYCLRKELRGTDAAKDALVKNLKDLVLNTKERRANYNEYQEVIKGVKLEFPSDDDCIRLTQRPL